MVRIFLPVIADCRYLNNQQSQQMHSIIRQDRGMTCTVMLRIYRALKEQNNRCTAMNFVKSRHAQRIK